MNRISALGFDLFNTLITVEANILGDAVSRLMYSLEQSGLALDHESFKKSHKAIAMRFFERARQDHRETHNRFWISEALESQGYHVLPDDRIIARAVDAYFSAFFQHCRLIPGTEEMLIRLKDRYCLGLLSNFTHPPAAREIIRIVGLEPFFDVVLISGDIGYRKPHPLIFRRFIEHLGVDKDQLVYVGDDPGPDIKGAQQAGIQPVWTTYVLDKNIPFAPGDPSFRGEEPDRSVPRISTWKELLFVLKELDEGGGA
ncbi:MAG: HAD family hydrolase [Thermodesulfobacteriota bacterium]|nr:HAD family hydrolase [Thermodesulfobacteriota bacterium]